MVAGKRGDGAEPAADPEATTMPPAPPRTDTGGGDGDPEPQHDTLPTGARLGEFEILSLLGRGGMGAVYKAMDVALGRVVALKTMAGARSDRPEALARFRQEAQAASQVVHPNVVAVHAFGTARGIPYIAMEYLSGQTLAARIARGPLGVQRTADLMLAVCSGVSAAHQRQIVHRDLKPANIFLAKSFVGETPKILDFGISRLGAANLTSEGDVLGTQQYLSPEQAAGRLDLDGRSDEYALGVILFECVTQGSPYASATLFGLLQDILEGRARRASSLRADLPPAFDDLIARAMSHDPAGRFPSVHDMGRALLPFASETVRQQWSAHFAAAEPGTPSAQPGFSGPVPVRPMTQVLRPGQPDSWQVRATNTAGPGMASGVSSASVEVVTSLPRARRPLVTVVLMLLAAAAAVAYFGLRDRGLPVASPPAVLPAPAASVAAPAPAAAPVPHAAPSEPGAAASTGARVPDLGPQPAAAALKDRATGAARPGSGKTDSKRVPPRPAKTGNRKKPPAIQYTPQGVPII